MEAPLPSESSRVSKTEKQTMASNICTSWLSFKELRTIEKRNRIFVL